MLLFTHPAMLRHEVPPGHAEHAGRLQAVLDGLEGMALDRREAPLAARAAIERVHPKAYVDAMESAFAQAREEIVALDPDTYVSPGSREAAYRATGACVAAVDAVMAGEDAHAFCAVRPPGHHAEPERPMGFCVFNNVAVGALHALEAHGLAKVAVLDFDVHHGNGTQAVAERDARVFFASSHQSPLYPGTGFAHERGLDDNVVNTPLPPGAGSAAFRAAWAGAIFPALEAFGPDLILVSAGFDAHRADPLANLAFEEGDFAWAGSAIRDLSLRCCKGRVVSTLEGGYDLDALSRSAAAYLSAF